MSAWVSSTLVQMKVWVRRNSFSYYIKKSYRA